MRFIDITAMAVACASGTPLVAPVTAPSINTPTAHPSRRTRRIVEAVQQIASLHERYSRTFGPERSALRAEINGDMDSLLGHLLDDYPGVPSSDDVAPVMDTASPPRRFEDLLVTIPDVAIPIAAVREIMTQRRISFDFHLIPQWERFVDRFRPAMMGSGFHGSTT